MPNTLNIESLLNYDSSFMKKVIGKLVIKEVRKDMANGLMQNNKQKLPYKSNTYAEYKRRGMERKTDGKRLKAFRGQSISSRQTKHVDMTLTGKTKSGFGVKSAAVNLLVMAFRSRDAKKVKGNQKHGYDLIGLNDKNKRLIVDELLKGFKDKGKVRKRVVVNVK